LFPEAKVAVHSDEGSITYRLAATLHLFCTGPALGTYILEINYTWTHNTFCDVDWQSHQAALRALEPYKMTLVKYLHGNLPVGSRAHRRDPRYPHSCPSCGAPQETDKHLFTCQAESRETWRRQFLQKLWALLDTENTPTGIMIVTLDGAETLFLGQAAGIREYEDPEYGRWADRQAAIGWANMLKGRISMAWITSQQHHQTPPAKDPSKWGKALALFMLQQFSLLWKLRNEDQHGRDPVSCREAEYSKVVSSIEDYCEREDLVPPEVANAVS